MVGNTIKNYEGILYPDKSNSSSDNYISDNPTEAKILIAMTLAFIVGIIQVKRKKLKIRIDYFSVIIS